MVWAPGVSQALTGAIYVTPLLYILVQQCQIQYNQVTLQKEQSALMVEEKFFTLAEVAERLKVNYRTVYRWVRSGDLSAIQFGREYRVTETDLQAFIEEHRTPRKEN